MSLIIDIADTIISITALIGLIITLLKYHSQSNSEFEMKVKKIAHDEIVTFIDSEKFKKSIIDILNDSQVSHRVNDIDTKITQLLTIMCYTDTKLKDSILCNKIGVAK